MPEELAETQDWLCYWKSRAEEAEAEVSALGEENVALTNRLLSSEGRLIRAYEALLGYG